MQNVTEEMRRDFVTAAWNGQAEKMQETLKAHPGALEWRHPGNGHTALISAVASGSLAEKAIALLLRLSADLNARDNKDMTALMHAASNGGIDTAKLLLEKGADTALCNDKGYTAAQIGDFKKQSWSRGVSALIRCPDAEKESERRRAQARRAAELTDNEAAQAHAGLHRPVGIRRPLALKRQGRHP